MPAQNPHPRVPGRTADGQPTTSVAQREAAAARRARPPPAAASAGTGPARRRSARMLHPPPSMSRRILEPPRLRICDVCERHAMWMELYFDPAIVVDDCVRSEYLSACFTATWHTRSWHHRDCE